MYETTIHCSALLKSYRDRRFQSHSLIALSALHVWVIASNLTLHPGSAFCPV